MVAARAGSVEVVRQLALAGADLDRRATRGQTALMWAAAQEHAPVVETLVEYGADVHIQSDSWAQYMAVTPHSRTKREIPHGENTALMFASRVGDLASVRHLVSAGADVNDRDAWGMSATAVAAFGGHAAVVETLLTHGADPNAFDAGVAPLHNAVMRNDTRMARALLERGADANARLGTWTPVRRASRDFHYPAAVVGAFPRLFYLGLKGAVRPVQVDAPAELTDLAAELEAFLTPGAPDDPDAKPHRFVLEIQPGATAADLSASMGPRNGSPVTFVLAGNETAVRAAGEALIASPRSSPTATPPHSTTRGRC